MFRSGNNNTMSFTKFVFHIIGNEQQNGPNCYVIVTGITADVIKESIAVKLPVNVLMKLEVNTNHACK